MRTTKLAFAALLLAGAAYGQVRADWPIEDFAQNLPTKLEIPPGLLIRYPVEIPLLPIYGPSTSDSPPILPHERATLSADAASIVEGNNRFALDIYRRLSSSRPDGNVLVSPFSISSALAMTYAGARGNTAHQMADVLGFTLPDDRLHAGFGELVRDLVAPRDGYQLSVANRMFGQAGYEFKQPFLDITSNHYGAPLERMNFAGDPEGSRELINDWVEEKTHDKIQDLLPQGSISPDSRLVLANAIYFKGSWKYKFETDATHDDSFFSSAGEESVVSMMFQQHSFRYSQQPGFKMLEMPYAGDDLSMVVLLPEARDGLADLESNLTPELLDSSLASLAYRPVNVHLPKFKFESSFELSDSLEQMGMTDAFSGSADFTGIADDGLAISAALHKAFVDVNEEGTEAAAATAIVITITSAIINPPPPEEFRADHPFLFALRDVHSGQLLFIGRVGDRGTASATEVAVPESTTFILSLFALSVVVLNRRSRIK